MTDDSREAQAAIIREVERRMAARHSRTVVILVAVACLSIGIAVGEFLHGSVGAKPEGDNRLTISSTAPTTDALSTAFSRVVDLVEPSVVNIRVVEGAETSSFIRQFTGSGVIVNSSGFILTNQHVVKQATTIKVKISTGKEYDGRVVGQDTETDLAVVKIDPQENLPAAKMGDSERLRVGDWVLAVGSPFGYEQTVTAGIISAKDRVTVENGPFQQFLQTDAAINPGNSGGPLINLSGEVIGINTEIATASGVFNGIGFALPSATAVDIYNQLMQYGRVKRGFLGIILQDLTPQIAHEYHVPNGEGVVVERVTAEDSPAARAGIQSGDVITSVNGRPVKTQRELTRLVASLPVGSQAAVALWRDGRSETVTITLEERNGDKAEQQLQPAPTPLTPGPGNGRAGPQRPDLKSIPPAQRRIGLGLSVKTLIPELAKLHGIDGAHGVLVTMVDPGSIAAAAGLQPNDVITKVNLTSIRAQGDYNGVIRDLKPGDDVVFKVLRKVETATQNKLMPLIISLSMP